MIARELSATINNFYMDFISIDGIESFYSSMYDKLAASVFIQSLFDAMVNKEFSSEPSRLLHYNWHFHDRIMWGESDVSFFKGTFDYQLANNAMHNRNFYPHHLGGIFCPT